ncbi:galactose mutarotase [Prolixibacteraceae bacterium JC049]|nr:galactose mutarotase [Prolixibacteraceae bacterium JC049]
MQIEQLKWGAINGKEVTLFSLVNPNGITVKLTNYGGIITEVSMNDKQGNKSNVVLGFDNLAAYTSEEYLANYPYLGAICGRYANRIGKGNFSVDGTTYKLAINNGPNHLHGGLCGFDKKVWDATVIENEDEVSVVLTYTSVDGEENYPGNLDVCVTYTLNDNDELNIDYKATTDKATPVNLTNHSYFNLSGENQQVLDHHLQVESDEYTNVDNNLIPVGTYKGVAGTPYDFRLKHPINQLMEGLADGYDMNFVVRGENGELRNAALLAHNESGRKIEVLTTQPGIQVYTGYYLPEIEGKMGRYTGVALETQHFPDSPNKPEFPETILQPGDLYQETTIYRFITE